MPSEPKSITRILRSLFRTLLRPTRTDPPRSRTSAKPSVRRSQRLSAGRSSNGVTTGLRAPYPGDFQGISKVRYAPKNDGAPDPGEIVWTWVPFEEDFSQGKDRPVLLVGRNGKRFLALMLTSKDHGGGHPGEKDYVDIGTGAWDRRGRPSEVKLDRVLQVSAADMRREGSVLDKRRFKMVAAGLRQQHGWK